MDAAWVAEYKRETDRKRRMEILKRAEEETGPDDPALLIRKELYGKRYDRRGDQDIDYYIRGWVNLEGLQRRVYLPGEKKRVRREIDSVLADWQYALCREQGEVGERALYDELFNMTLFYMELCEKDKTYNAILLGLGKIKENRRVEKIAKEIALIIKGIPEKLGIEKELEPFQKAAGDAFRYKYPSDSALLDDRLGA
ncbi:MAG: hypothetical protein IJT05_03320 [Lachnospiraceae bacterium]|nr:hypothetical protein [Lachnospiraceae bacterium]